jgi:hypothetical protein
MTCLPSLVLGGFEQDVSGSLNPHTILPTCTPCDENCTTGGALKWVWVFLTPKEEEKSNLGPLTPALLLQ